jgi:hypothetical protein
MQSASSFESFIGTMPLSDSSPPCVSVVRLSAFSDRPDPPALRRRRGLPVLVRVVSRHAWVLRLRGTRSKLAMSLPAMWPSPSLNKVGVPDWVFEARIPACRCLCLRFGFDLTINSARLKVRMDRVSFPVRLFHSRQHAGLSRRTQRHLNRQRSFFLRTSTRRDYAPVSRILNI